MKANATPSPKFAADINLDDEDEAQEFFNRYCRNTPKAIAKDLGFEGEGAEMAAENLFDYSCLKLRACKWRSEGLVCLACAQEEILDQIYHEKILPFVECW